MLLFLTYIKLLTAVCFFHVVKEVQCYSIFSTFPVRSTNNFGGCEDISNTIYSIKQLSSFDAFKLITELISDQTNPPEVRQIREKLLAVVQNGLLNVDNIIIQLGNLPIYNKYDLLLTTLTAIAEKVNNDYIFSNDLNLLIFYVLRKRYLGKNDQQLLKYPSCNFEEILLPAPNINFDCSTLINKEQIDFLTNSILDRLTLILTEKPIPSPVVVPSISIRQQQEVDVNNVIIEDLINLIPKPKYETEIEMYQKFVDLMKNTQVQQIVKTIDRSKYKTNQEFLDVVLTTITKTITTEEVQTTVNFYKNYKEIAQVGFNYANLVSVLPQPKSQKEANYYNIIKTFLTSNEIYSLSQDLHLQFDQKVNLQVLLIKVVKQLISSKKVVSTSVIEALNYYLPVIEGKQSNYNFSNLVLLLPTPTTPEGLEYFDVLRSILNSNEIYVLLQNAGDLKNVSNEQDLLEIVLYNLARNSANQQLALAAKYFINVTIEQKFGFNYFNLLNMMNLSETYRQSFVIIENYMYTAEFENIVSQLNLKSLSDRQKLISILNAIANNVINEEIVNAVQQILRSIYQREFVQDMLRIVSQIPEPTSEDERSKLTIIKQFLTSDDGYNLLQDIDRSLFPEEKLLAQEIFKTVLQSAIDSTIIEAFKYYYDIIANLEEVEFMTKKEIHKKFKLHEIFSDALDIHNLNFPQKEAFVMFYKYISKINPQAISNFSSWDKAQSRGQFAKLMFNYLLQQPETPEDLKNNITILMPLVQMNGNAALPP